MNLKDYQRQSARTDVDETLEQALEHISLGLISESGEISNAVKKWRFQGHDEEESEAHLIIECGDLMWYTAKLCRLYGQNLEDIRQRVPTIGAFHSTTRKAIGISRLVADINSTFISQGGFGFSAPMLQDKDFKKISYLVEAIEDFVTYPCRSSMGYCLDANIAKIKERYPEGFDPERSKGR